MQKNKTCPSTATFDHSFGQTVQNPMERRMIAITLVTVVVMVIEIVAGKLTGSMALYSDGIHMGTHVLALGLAAAAYVFARKQADNRAFSFGSGKAGILSGYTSAIILGMSACMLVVDAIERLLHPEAIAYTEALIVAVIGLVVNGASALALHTGGDHHHHHHHHHHEGNGERCNHQHQDHNHQAALIHVAADALTSVGAIVALFAAWKLGWNWLDPLMALIASALIAIWAKGLLRDTSKILLDQEASETARTRIINALESDGDSRVIDLHVWSVGSGVYTLVAAVVTHLDRKPDDYKELLPDSLSIYHPVIEVRRCYSCA